ncbi:hypothetical protein L1987_22652 [Smallanthus sonchifolius]|uniref:Uncharacterized protein n=1 Tax=Smallanthus sonchifolius TaxID=185202 RepID=A0ACB9IER2_9ASTR|nr:hypothetical protein L1987_22652 [Smallanthus sonchifolius]
MEDGEIQQNQCQGSRKVSDNQVKAPTADLPSRSELSFLSSGNPDRPLHGGGFKMSPIISFNNSRDLERGPNVLGAQSLLAQLWTQILEPTIFLQPPTLAPSIPFSSSPAAPNFGLDDLNHPNGEDLVDIQTAAVDLDLEIADTIQVGACIGINLEGYNVGY